MAVFSEHADPVAKVSILPAGQALGVTEQLPVDERHLYPESYLRDSLAIRMGGRAGEKLVLKEVSSGAANDLAGATQLAERMVREFGMSPRLGPVGFGNGGPAYLGAQQIRSRDYAEATQALIDEEVSRLLKEADERATAILEEHRDVLDQVTNLLIEREMVDGAEVYALAGRPVPKGAEEAIAPRPTKVAAKLSVARETCREPLHCVSPVLAVMLAACACTRAPAGGPPGRPSHATMASPRTRSRWGTAATS